MLVSTGSASPCPCSAWRWPSSARRVLLHREPGRIITDNDHTRAKILEVKADRLREAWRPAGSGGGGFQGVSIDREITTLGRGGSDATAVALAAVLGADACEIYTDVTGSSPRTPVVPTAHRINRISFDEMLEIAATGAAS